MDQLFPSEAPIKSALFVDFDNIYIGLSKSDPVAAERFAADPARWLAWLEKGLPVRNGNMETRPRQRSILIRRCYPNPDAGFRRFRSFFTSAAFSVIDCPTLTRTGKNSSDIYMVMDILDALDHKTHFDEFIIFSGDSDFMPVLLRLRSHDRRTTTLAIDFMPPAYKAACDLVISEEEFIEDALGVTSDGNCSGNGAGRSRVPVITLKEMAARVYQAVCEESEVAGADLPDILKDFREFRESNNWLGFGTSQRLAEALICSEQRLSLVRINPMMYKLVLKPQIVRSEILPAEQPVIPADAPILTIEKPTERALQPNRLTPLSERFSHPADREGRVPFNAVEKTVKADLTRLRAQVIAVVKDLASNSRSPILLARASQYVVSKLGPQVLETQWAGAGSFKRLLQGAEDLGLEITTQPEPGYIFDPQRHTNPAMRSQSTGSSNAQGEDQVSSQTNETAESALEGNLIPVSLQPGAYRLEHLSQQYEEAEEENDEAEEEYEESLPSLEEFSRRVSQVTGAPDLTSKQYALIFEGIINELQEIAEGQKTYNTYQSSKAVSDWCAEQGEQISRSDVVLIFKGIIFQDGVRFGKHPGSYNAYELAEVVRNNIKALSRRSRLELSEYEERLLDESILGALHVGAENFSEESEQPGGETLSES